MRKFGLLFLSALSINLMAEAQLRNWGVVPSAKRYAGYFAIRAGASYFNTTPENDMNEMYGTYGSVFLCNAVDGGGNCTDSDWLAYGPVYRLNIEYPNASEIPAVGELLLGNIEYANFSEWEMGKDMKEMTGHFSVAVGTYIPQYRNIRAELEVTQYLDVEYKSYPFLKGYTESAVDGELIYDENLSSSLKSTISSSTFMLNVLYDFASSEIRKKGDFIPFVGAGIGLAINQTETTLFDQQGEFSNPSDASYFKYLTCPTGSSDTWSPQCYYTPFKKTETSVAWNVIVGGSYVVSPASFIEAGIKMTNLGTASWEIGKGTQSEPLLTTDSFMNTSVFIGYRRNF